MTRLLAMIGSGETSPTMVTVHRDLVARLGMPRPEAILLATPYAFQENAASVSARAQRYFGHSVGLEVSLLAGVSADADPAMAAPMLGGDAHPEREAARIRDADWVFAGPGNPPYALAHWQAGPVAGALRHRLLAGHGVTVLASAAAATAGLFTLPVYEIYKAGGALRWLPGLDLLGPLGLPGAAVIPHYDNAEGRGYDTRYCYLGEQRLRVMERDLPEDSAILGIDEHTAVLIDLDTMTVDIRGRGRLTVRRRGESRTLPAGTKLPLGDLIEPQPDPAGACFAGAAGLASVPVPVPLPEVMAAAERRFEQGDTVAAILDLESAVADWDADTDEDQGPEQARALLRTLIARLARPAPAGSALRAAVEPLLELRATLRGQHRYDEADMIRNALTTAGLDIRDTPDGTWWQIPGPQ
jgi:hypothetical protein